MFAEVNFLQRKESCKTRDDVDNTSVEFTV